MDNKIKLVCHVCGHPIEHTLQIGADIDGTYVDYVNRNTGGISIVICVDCWTKMNELFDWDYNKSRETFKGDCNEETGNRY